MPKIRIPVLAAALTLLVGAAPAAACLSMAREAAVAEHHPTGCDPSPDAPSATLCADSATVVPVNDPVGPTAVAAGLDAGSHPGEAPMLDRADAAPARVTPRARSAPIHLLHATFLI